eukprot:TRINITY_DN1422_c0_g2_i1.p1 TRINITY_DN1422_c0_g2~~TRINITY_DN1422_c0_g2_i1.p1  ORF type:complete len:983 (+),score=165.24 TRINITY_DN1422_c0_g2_i1:317-3265(+)
MRRKSTPTPSVSNSAHLRLGTHPNAGLLTSSHGHSNDSHAIASSMSVSVYSLSHSFPPILSTQFVSANKLSVCDSPAGSLAPSWLRTRTSVFAPRPPRHSLLFPFTSRPSVADEKPLLLENSIDAHPVPADKKEIYLDNPKEMGPDLPQKVPDVPASHQAEITNVSPEEDKMDMSTDPLTRISTVADAKTISEPESNDIPAITNMEHPHVPQVEDLKPSSLQTDGTLLPSNPKESTEIHQVDLKTQLDPPEESINTEPCSDPVQTLKGEYSDQQKPSYENRYGNASITLANHENTLSHQIQQEHPTSYQPDDSTTQVGCEKGSGVEIPLDASNLAEILSRVRHPVDELAPHTTLTALESIMIYLMESAKEPVTVDYLYGNAQKLVENIPTQCRGSLTRISRKGIQNRLRHSYTMFKRDSLEVDTWTLRTTVISSEDMHLIEKRASLTKELSLDQDDEECEGSSDNLNASDDTNRVVDAESGDESERPSVPEYSEPPSTQDIDPPMSDEESEDKNFEDLPTRDKEVNGHPILGEPTNRLESSKEIPSQQTTAVSAEVEDTLSQQSSHSKESSEKISQDSPSADADMFENVITDLQALVAKVLIESNGKASFSFLTSETRKYLPKLRKRTGMPYSAEARRVLSATLNMTSCDPFFMREVQDESVWSISLKGRQAYAQRIQYEISKKPEERASFLWHPDYSDMQMLIKSVIDSQEGPFSAASIRELVEKASYHIKLNTDVDSSTNLDSAILALLTSDDIYSQEPDKEGDLWRVTYKTISELPAPTTQRVPNHNPPQVSPKAAVTSAKNIKVEPPTPFNPEADPSSKTSALQLSSLQGLIGNIIARNGGSVETKKLLSQVQAEYTKLRRSDGSSYLTDIRKAILASLTTSPHGMFKHDADNEKRWTFATKQIQDHFSIKTEGGVTLKRPRPDASEREEGEYDGELEIDDDFDRAEDAEDEETASLHSGSKKRNEHKRLYRRSRKSE